MTKKTKVLLADDHLYVSETLLIHLEERASARFEVVAVARDGAEAVAQARRHKPGLVVMDVQMPRMSGIEALREIKKMASPPVVLMLSAHEDQANVLDALHAGADDYLYKRDMTPERLTAHMDRALAKTLHFQNMSLKKAAGLIRAAGGAPDLTRTEMEILRLAAHGGMTAKEIAMALSGGKMSIRTVATHWQHIYEKLDARNQAQAVCAAIRHGLISAEPV